MNNQQLVLNLNDIDIITSSSFRIANVGVIARHCANYDKLDIQQFELKDCLDNIEINKPNSLSHIKLLVDLSCFKNPYIQTQLLTQLAKTIHT